MQELNTSEVVMAETQNIFVSVYRELIDTDCNKNKLWGYCLRIENNSADSVILTGKDLYITDNFGRCLCDVSDGFHHQIPNLEPGECFEYEDTADIKADSAVLYGFCKAVTKSGKEFRIKLPPINLSADINFLPDVYH